MSSYQKAVDDYYLRQAKGAPYFRGPAYQRGHGLGGIFRALMRVATPIFRSAAPIVKAGAKEVARDAIRAGAEIANDAISGRDIGSSIEQHGNEAAERLIGKGTKKLLAMMGPPTKRRRKAIKGRRATSSYKHRDVFSR